MNLRLWSWSLKINLKACAINTAYRIVFTLTLLFITLTNVYSQCGITFGNSYVGTATQFNTYAQVLAGATVTDYFSIQYNVPYAANCPKWTLKVRANGNFTNGSSSIAPQYVAIRFNRVDAGGPSASAIGVSTTSAVALSTTDVTIVNQSNAPFAAPPDYYTEHKLDMIVQGGSQLAVGTGTYSAVLTFSLYNQSGQLMATQNLTASFVVNFSNTCSGAALSAFATSGYNFTTYAQQMAGGTTNQTVSVQYTSNQASCTGWSLKVHTSGSFTNGTNSVAPQYVSLRFNSVTSGSPTAAAIGISSNPVALSTADVPLINQSNAPFQANTATTHSFDLIIQGGNQLLVGNGTYTTNLIFSLYNASNQLVSTSTTAVSFLVNTTTNSSYTMILQNGGTSAGLSFTNMSNYVNGVSLTQAKALKVTGYAAYQIIVKTTTDNLTSGTSSKTIPVTAIKLQTSSTTASIPNVTYSVVSLSSVDQMVINNPYTDYHYQIVEYDLKYYTNPADARFSLPTGTFSTNVIFVVIPK
ncbi:MAG: hypothetical protein JWR67_3849 [Mucilaginibacter sp.]|nr:hypothetical protein [Mucilaginibacter sp.]